MQPVGYLALAVLIAPIPLLAAGAWFLWPAARDEAVQEPSSPSAWSLPLLAAAVALALAGLAAPLLASPEDLLALSTPLLGWATAAQLAILGVLAQTVRRPRRAAMPRPQRLRLLAPLVLASALLAVGAASTLAGLLAPQLGELQLGSSSMNLDI